MLLVQDRQAPAFLQATRSSLTRGRKTVRFRGSYPLPCKVGGRLEVERLARTAKESGLVPGRVRALCHLGLGHRLNGSCKGSRLLLRQQDVGGSRIGSASHVGWHGQALGEAVALRAVEFLSSVMVGWTLVTFPWQTGISCRIIR